MKIKDVKKLDRFLSKYSSKMPVKVDKVSDTQHIKRYINGYVAIKKLGNNLEFLVDITKTYGVPFPDKVEGLYEFKKEYQQVPDGFPQSFDNVMTDKLDRKTVTLDRKLLISLLESLDSDRIKFSVHDGLSPVRLKGKNERACIMPIRPKKRAREV